MKKVLKSFLLVTVLFLGVLSFPSLAENGLQKDSVATPSVENLFSGAGTDYKSDPGTGGIG
ncbi:hypothetical protein [Halobacillus sp. BBL2006]|uniref:hypothetical protein n=1 Tax=Halobacillus sp. BBL2006 TaxID=1543706 RepID=UPI000543FF84|nr:hypothetical protein [Halobacillus sp. BBL2006]KHE68657.1 hypothetical protein LD39_14190 [Halobacillus sp. BBL2006]